VEIDFELTSINDADPFDPSWLLDAEKHCREADASAHGGVGPFGLVILASDNMEEHTVVHFRVYKSQENYMILMCSDLRRLVFFSKKEHSPGLCIDRCMCNRIDKLWIA
jgi:beta-fructofuranosidase